MKNYTLLAALTFLSTSVMAEIISIDIINLDSGKSAGIVTISESDYGTIFTPKLKDLPAGIHGFHIHSNASCESSVKNGQIIQAGAAGGHYDPKETGKHGFPWTTDNHLGDLPALYVGIDGVANQPVLAPRVTLSDVKGRALMVHLGGDNHSDHPNKLGGGGSRILCGVIKS